MPLPVRINIRPQSADDCVNELNEQIALLLKGGGQHEIVLEQVLREVLKHFRSETGTIHRLDAGKQLLHLVAQTGLPPQVLEVAKAIPVGKGIAGQVIARGGPVTLCNLQTDTGGAARPGARQTGVGGALCVPLRDGDKIVGTIGVGTMRPYEYTPDETRLLEEIGRMIGTV
jgi:GAF domain-containing protein